MPAVPRPGLRVSAGLTIPEAELSWRFSRSSGPGGQGVAERRLTAKHRRTDVKSMRRRPRED